MYNRPILFNILTARATSCDDSWSLSIGILLHYLHKAKPATPRLLKVLMHLLVNVTKIIMITKFVH